MGIKNLTSSIVKAATNITNVTVDTKKDEGYSTTYCWDKIKNIFITPPPPPPSQWEKLTFTPEAYAKLMCYINLIGGKEVTGFGKVEGEYITDVKLIEQEVRAAFVECNPEAVMAFMQDIPEEELPLWVIDWHSHVDMGVTPSGTDTTNWKVQHEIRGGAQFIAMIVNKSQVFTCNCYVSPEHQTKIELYVPHRDQLSEEKLTEIYDACEAEIKTFCREYTYTSGYKGRTAYQGTLLKDDDEELGDWRNYHTTTKKKEEKRNDADTKYDRCAYCGKVLWTVLEKSSELCSGCQKDFEQAGINKAELQDTIEVDNAANKVAEAIAIAKAGGKVTATLDRCMCCDELLVSTEELKNGFCEECLEGFEVEGNLWWTMTEAERTASLGG